jgi:hypothetical protein
LSAEERALLENLQSPTDAAPIPAVEDSPEMEQAVEDDSPLPAAGGDADDPDTPRFKPPNG